MVSLGDEVVEGVYWGRRDYANAEQGEALRLSRDSGRRMALWIWIMMSTVRGIR